MLDNDFRDAETAGGSQNGHKAMELAIETDFVKYFTAVAFHAAVVIVQADACQTADEPIENTRGEHFLRRVVAGSFPAADNVVLLVHLFQELGHFVRIVLQIGVESNNRFAAGGTKAGV